jgi:hypothetical protein
MNYRWDEWVECSRLVQIDKEGLNLQKKLATEYASTDLKSNENDVYDFFYHFLTNHLLLRLNFKRLRFLYCSNWVKTLNILQIMIGFKLTRSRKS